MGGSFASRRLSEFVGVALFGLALLWLISLASYNASDPVVFFTTGSDRAPLNFGGMVGAFLAELSYQTLGYTAYLIPVVLVVSGWHYFWCRLPDAAYTKLVGAGLLFACQLCQTICDVHGSLLVNRSGGCGTGDGTLLDPAVRRNQVCFRSCPDSGDGIARLRKQCG